MRNDYLVHKKLFLEICKVVRKKRFLGQILGFQKIF